MRRIFQAIPRREKNFLEGVLSALTGAGTIASSPRRSAARRMGKGRPIQCCVPTKARCVAVLTEGWMSGQSVGVNWRGIREREDQRDIRGGTGGLTEISARPTRVRFQVWRRPAAWPSSPTSIGSVSRGRRPNSNVARADNRQQIGWMMAAFMIGYGLFEIPWGSPRGSSGCPEHPRIHRPGRLGFDRMPRVRVPVPRQPALVFSFLLVLRFLFGAFQAGTFPAFSRMMADWMPTTERGGPRGPSGCPAGSAASSRPDHGWIICDDGGWQMPLVLVSRLGLGWCAWFWPWFRNRPDEMPGSIKRSESLIEAGRGCETVAAHGPIPWGRMVRMRSVWALWLMYGFLGFSGNFYLTHAANLSQESPPFQTRRSPGGCRLCRLDSGWLPVLSEDRSRTRSSGGGENNGGGVMVGSAGLVSGGSGNRGRALG